MKRKGLLFFGVLLLFVLAGCGKSAKDTYLEALKKSDQASATSFTLGIDQINVTEKEKTEDATLKEVLQQLQATQLTGEMIEGATGKHIKGNLTLKVGEETVALDMIIGEKVMYLSGDVLASATKLMSKLSSEEIPIDADMFADFKGKYIQLDADSVGEFYPATSSFTDLKETSTSDTFVGYIKTLDKSTFKKEKDFYTHTFTKKELLDFIAYVEKNGTDEEKEAVKDGKEAIEALELFDLTLGVNESGKQQQLIIHVKATQEEEAVELKATMNLKQEDKTTTITLPKENQVITIQELSEKIMGAMMNQALQESQTEWEGFTQEELQEMAKELKQLSKEEQESILGVYQSLLPSEDYKQLKQMIEE